MNNELIKELRRLESYCAKIDYPNDIFNGINILAGSCADVVEKQQKIIEEFTDAAKQQNTESSKSDCNDCIDENIHNDCLGTRGKRFCGQCGKTLITIKAVEGTYTICPQCGIWKKRDN